MYSNYTSRAQLLPLLKHHSTIVPGGLRHPSMGPHYAETWAFRATETRRSFCSPMELKILGRIKYLVLEILKPMFLYCYNRWEIYKNDDQQKFSHANNIKFPNIVIICDGTVCVWLENICLHAITNKTYLFCGRETSLSLWIDTQREVSTWIDIKVVVFTTFHIDFEKEYNFLLS